MTITASGVIQAWLNGKIPTMGRLFNTNKTREKENGHNSKRPNSILPEYIWPAPGSTQERIFALFLRLVWLSYTESNLAILSLESTSSIFVSEV